MEWNFSISILIGGDVTTNLFYYLFRARTNNYNNSWS